MKELADYLGSWNMYRRGNERISLFSMFIEERCPSEQMIAGRVSDYFGTGNFYGHLGREFIIFDLKFPGNDTNKPDGPYGFRARPAYESNVNSFLKRHSERYKPKILSQIISELNRDVDGLMIGEIVQVGKKEIPFFIYPTAPNDERLDVYETFMSGIEI